MTTMASRRDSGIPKNQLAVVKEFEESFRGSFRGGSLRQSIHDSLMASYEEDYNDDANFSRTNFRSSIYELPETTEYQSNRDLSEARDTITANESKGVNALKTIMYLTLIFSAATIGTATLWFLQDERLRLLELEVEAVAGEAVSDVQAYLDGISAQLFQLSTSFSSEYQSYLFANNNDDGHPTKASSSGVHLTLPHFDQRIKNDPKSELIFYAPIISTGSDVLLNEWADYSIQHQNWIDEALAERGWDALTTQIPDQIYSYSSDDDESNVNTDNILDHGIVTPIWQVSPVPRNRSIINLNAMTVPVLSKLWHTTTTSDSSSSSSSSSSESSSDPAKARMSATLDAEFFEKFVDDNGKQGSLAPESFLSTPVYKTFDHNTNSTSGSSSSTPFGYVFGLVSWQKAVSTAFQESHLDLSINLQESCGSSSQSMTFLVQHGGTTTYQIPGAPPAELVDVNLKEEYDIPFDGCNYHMTVHALDGAQHEIRRDVPILGFVIAALLLVFLMLVFHFYNRVVRERQVKLLAAAKRSNAVVSSLFPEAVQNRLMEEVAEKESQKAESRRQFLKKTGSINFSKLKEEKEEESAALSVSKHRGKAIADFFPETTIMFADIVGFTAWSSMREPTQVFELLESIYSCFDEIARKRRVFKVETIGDCYVAVVGLPDPCEEHAIVMARFAHDCRLNMNKTVKELELTLGPDTADLSMRIGLHSGPVTAGVLRGDKARFQLFGDTMNTTSRIETTGKANRVHISEQTAKYLMDAGKKHWLALREDKVTAKGKGELTTYWLRIGRASRGRRGSLQSVASESTRSLGDLSLGVESVTAKDNLCGLSEKEMRLVDWITNELERFLLRIEFKRNVIHGYPDSLDSLKELEEQSLRNLTAKMPLDEVVDIIDFPAFDADLTDFLMMSNRHHDPHSSSLKETVKLELHDYVQSVASMYKDNLFHSFEHASHVTMSVAKLISRIVAPGHESDVTDKAMKLHQSTYGIASDPVTQFAMALSSLIHDVDHPGVPNARLIKENHPFSGRYKEKSIAEQNSVDKSWRLLLDPKYANLRRTIYQTKSEYQRFRQVLVNTAMATDIMDAALNEKRKERWDMAFTKPPEEDPALLMNRRATVVIEHIIIASDIAHTMQHWHVYRKWNGRLFEEMYRAFENKRADLNPADKWYQGEIDFFDSYIIPLAQKLKDCGVFGVSSDELLNYARQNRQEWDRDGKKAVQTMLKAMRIETDGPIRGVSRYNSSDSANFLGSNRGSGGSARKERSPRPVNRVRNRPPGRRASAESDRSQPKTRNRPPTRRASTESDRSEFGVSQRTTPSRNSVDPEDRSAGLPDLGSPPFTSKNSDNKALLLQSTSLDLDMSDENDEHFDDDGHYSFVNLNDMTDDMSHQSDLTEDSYARKGRDLKLPEELNVLIIDDDNLNRRLFTRAIMSLAPKWIVSEAESVEEALGIIQNSTDAVDVIFMDHHAGAIVGDFLGSAAVKLLRLKGVNCLICAMSSRDKDTLFDTGDPFNNSTVLFEPNALIKEVNQIMYQSADFGW